MEATAQDRRKRNGQHNPDIDEWAEHVVNQLEWVTEPYRSRYIAELKRQLFLNGRLLDVEIIAVALRQMPNEVYRARLMQNLECLLNRTVEVFGTHRQRQLEANRES